MTPRSQRRSKVKFQRWCIRMGNRVSRVRAKVNETHPALILVTTLWMMTCGWMVWTF